jgi:hypothetical protein
MSSICAIVCRVLPQAGYGAGLVATEEMKTLLSVLKGEDFLPNSFQ